MTIAWEVEREGWDLKPARQALGTLKRHLQFIPQALYNPWSIFSNRETLIYVLDVKNCFESSRKRDSKGGKIWKGLQSGDQLEATGSEKAGGPELRGSAGRRRGEKDHDVFIRCHLGQGSWIRRRRAMPRFLDWKTGKWWPHLAEIGYR